MLEWWWPRFPLFKNPSLVSFTWGHIGVRAWLIRANRDKNYVMRLKNNKSIIGKRKKFWFRIYDARRSYPGPYPVKMSVCNENRRCVTKIYDGNNAFTHRDIWKGVKKSRRERKSRNFEPDFLLLQLSFQG